MPNQITTAGLETKDRDELITELTTALLGIYGADANLDPDSPDGQWIAIIVQAALDNLDLAAQIYSSFDPDVAIGRALDARAAINGVARLGGTYTFQDIEIVTDRSLNLAGLDGDIEEADGTGYTVSDDAGNQFILAVSQVIAAAGTYTFSFRAKNNGAVETIPNTITTPVTIVLGVVSVNNPASFTSLGLDEETDAQLRIRRRKSVALSSQGYLDGLLAALLNINGVVSAFVYENVTGTTDGDGVPGHSIWVIVEGGDDDDVARAIYSKRNAGAGMKGDEVVDILQVDDTVFQIRFDRTETEDLYIKFDATSIDGIGTIDTTFLKAQIVANMIPGVNETLNVNDLATIVQTADENCLVTGAKFSYLVGGPFYDFITPSEKKNRFVLATGRIAITVL